MKNAFLITVIFSLIAPVSFAVDSVTRRSDGSRIRGTITSATVSEIVVKSASGKETTIPITDILKVEFDKEPSELIAARANERSGALAVALEKYQDAQKTSNKSDRRLSAELDFLIARTMAKMAETDPSQAAPAVKLLEDFRAAHDKNFRYLQATLLHAKLLADGDQIEQGKQLLSQVQQSSVKSYQLEAGIALGKMMLKSDDIDSALQAFTTVVEQSSGDDTSKGALFAGLLGQASCLQKQAQYDEAIKVLDRIIKESGDAETATLASAWLRKGDCLVAQKQIKAARMAYLHVDVLYPGEPAQHSEALFRLINLWGATGHADRAAEASAKLVSLYPNSAWAKKN